MKQCRKAKCALLLGSFFAAACAGAEAQLGEVAVSAAGEKPKGSLGLRANALPAAVTVIDREQIERINVGRDYADLLRRVSGINAYSFGQGDIGSPIKMRGFTGTGAHGSDVAIHVDGVPQNIPSASQGGSGMSDLSWLTPDMIERIEVIKGAFSALFGDQNRAGAINIVTRSAGESGVSGSIGSYATARGSLVHSAAADNGTKHFVVADIHRADGYRDNSDSLRGTVFAKLSRSFGGAVWALRGSYYRSDWDAPGYLSYNGLRSGAVGPRDRDPNAPELWGEAERYGLVLTRTPAQGEAGLHATAFIEHYEKRRANPVGSNPAALNVQNDDRTMFGGRLLYNLLFSDRATLAFGTELRADRGTGFNERRAAGASGRYNSYWDLDLLSYSVFAQGQYRLFDGFKLVGGARTDVFDYDIENRKQPAASVDYRKSATTPRAGFVWTPHRAIDLFANIGEGIRSPAERELSPAGAGNGLLGAAGGQSFAHLRPPKVKAADVGFNALLGERVKLSASGYRSQNQREIRETLPGSGIFASIGDTRRDGWEVEAQFFASDALIFYGSYGKVRGRVENPPAAGQKLIAGLPEDTWRLGFEYTTPFAGGRLLVNGDAFLLSGAPYYVGAGATPRYSRDYVRYDLRATYEQGRWRYTVSGVFQPRRFASEQAGATLDPRPKVDLGLTASYRF
ncbi:MAG: TonB-dependent receptor [Azospira sp.]|jgi:outer membrane receptor protein involved in Fe transport|nr:TonB-dependent receptor [Azospira sp.]